MKSTDYPFTNELTGAEFCKKNGPIIIKQKENGQCFFESISAHPLFRSGYVSRGAVDIINRAFLKDKEGKKPRLRDVISENLDFAVVHFVDEETGQEDSCPTLMPKQPKTLYGLEDWSDDVEKDWSDDVEKDCSGDVEKDCSDDVEKDWSDDAEKEIRELVALFRDMHFTRSNQISRYIVENKLGYKYPNIFGILEMTDGYETWEFEGGIAPKYYAEICRRLELGNNNTGSWVENFKSYNELH